MKYKYLISKNKDRKELTIKEFAELDKEDLTFVCEETYDQKDINSAIEKDIQSLIAVIRTPNFFPSVIYAGRIAESIIEFQKSKNSESIEVVFDDIEFIPKGKERVAMPERLEELPSDDIDIIDDEEFDEDFEDKPGMKKFNPSIKVAEDDYDDFEEED